MDHEDAIEAYYNVAVTRCLGVTMDLPVVDQGLKKMLSSNGTPKSVDTAVVGGLPGVGRF